MEPIVLSPRVDVRSRYVWEAGFPRGRFRDVLTGRFVAWSTVRAVLDETIASAGGTVRSLSESLRAGTINVAEWQRAMEREIKSTHLASFALQRGGFQNLTPADYGRIGNLLFNPSGTVEAGSAGQYAFLRRFAEQIQNGLPLDGNFIRRVDQYVKAGRQTYHIAETREMIDKGFTEERYVLHVADHCRSSARRMGCIEREAKGWQPIGELPGIGGATCHQNDRCTKLYRNEAGVIFDPSKT